VAGGCGRRRAPRTAAAPEFTFEERADKTVMTMIHRGLPTAELRDEHRAGVPPALARLEQAIEKSSRLREGDPG
jgi:hypothetical protein